MIDHDHPLAGKRVRDRAGREWTMHRPAYVPIEDDNPSEGFVIYVVNDSGGEQFFPLDHPFEEVKR